MFRYGHVPWKEVRNPSRASIVSGLRCMRGCYLPRRLLANSFGVVFGDNRTKRVVAGGAATARLLCATRPYPASRILDTTQIRRLIAFSSPPLQRFTASTIQPFDVCEAKTRTPFPCPWVFLAIRSMSAIGIICHWNLVPAAATRFPSSIIIAAIALPHRRQFRRGPLMRNTCSK